MRASSARVQDPGDPAHYRTARNKESQVGLLWRHAKLKITERKWRIAISQERPARPYRGRKTWGDASNNSPQEDIADITRTQPLVHHARGAGLKHRVDSAG